MSVSVLAIATALLVVEGWRLVVQGTGEEA